MKQQNNNFIPLKAGCVAAVTTFVALTCLTNGFIEVSLDVGVWKWLGEMTSYALGNKLLEKLIASVAVGGVASLATHMISYGRLVKSQRRGRMTQLHFQQDEPGSTRTA